MKKEIENIEMWKTDVVNRFLITKDCLDLILSQSTKALTETIETAKTISARADKLLAILLPILSGLIVYLSTVNYTVKLTFLSLTAICITICVLISLGFCALNHRKYIIAIPGEYPKDILQSQFIDNYIEEKYVNRQYINLGVHICEDIQAKIAQNDVTNRIRMFNNSWALYILFAIPFCPLVAYILLILNLHYCGIAT